MADNLFDAFPATSFAAWEHAAKEELHGANPAEKLAYSIGAVRLAPIYFPAGTQQENISLAATPHSTRGPRTWYNCPRVRVADPVRANTEALEHLQQGADGIFFELEKPCDFNVLLRQIEWPMVALSFSASASEKEHLNGLASYLEGQKGTTVGAWYGSSVPNLSHDSFRFAGLALAAHATPESTAQLLAHALADKSRISNVAIRVDLGNEFLVEVCKLRAIRWVWKQALHDLKIPDSPLFLHAVSPAWHPEPFQPHGNMLKATNTAMAAILGGCDLLTVDPEDDANDMMRRVARNVGNILREESHFNKVSDPLAGAYLVDELTRQLTEELWRLIQPALP